MADPTGRRPKAPAAPWPAPHDALPLSVVQEAMWISWQRDPGGREHLVPLALEVKGELDTERMRAAVAELSRRHPLLRARVTETPRGTRLTWAGSEPVPLTVRTVDASRDEAVAAAVRPLDLSRGPLARAEVLRGPDHTVVLLTVHHLVLDGRSTPLLLEGLRRAYAGLPLGGQDDPGPVIDHARRSWELALGAEGEPLRAYWRTALAGPAEPRPLPVRAGAGTFRQWPCAVEPELTERVRVLARELGATRFTVMFAALFVTLHHYTTDDDLIVSAPWHGRSDPALAGRVGCFVNVLPYRQRLRGTRTYAQLITDLRARVRAGTAHGDLPLPAILRAADLSAPAERARTHQAVFQYVQFGHPVEGGTDVSRIELTDGCELTLLDLTDVADHRLTVLLVEDGRGSRMLWKDPGGTLGTDLLASMARDHLAVVADMAAHPGRTLAEGLARLPAPGLPEPDARPVATPAIRTAAGPATPPPPAPAFVPASPTAAALAGIWHRVLGVPVLSADDSFFEVGGHSLLATTLLTRVGRRFGVELSMRDLFAHPGFGELVRLVDRRLADAGRAAPPPVTAGAPSVGPAPKGAFPASGFQESIWLAQRLDPAHATYHVPLSWDVTGDLDPEALREALALLVSRHEILRTRFLGLDGRLYQEVAPPWAPELEREDLTTAAEPDRRPGIWADDAAKSLDPASGRLLRAALFTTAPHRHVLSLCVHHLVLDGESVPVLVRELERCYAAARSAAPLPPAPRQQYRDLVAAQGSRPEAWADLAYWRRRLEGAPSSLGLDAPERPEPGGNIGLCLDPGTARGLLPVQRAEKVSAFMIQATAAAAALHRWTGLADLTFCVPVAHRGEAAFQDVIGPCLNTLVLRSRCTRETTLAGLLRALREDIVAAFEHRAAPFEDVVGGLRQPRSPGHTPYADVLLNSVSLTRWSGRLGTAGIAPVDFVARRTETSKFPVTITFAENAGAVRGSVAYRGDRAGGEAVGWLADELSGILGRFGALLPEPVFVLDPHASAGRNRADS
ncbi:condensation domain-containing protein [Streptomyces sp. NPDC001667]